MDIENVHVLERVYGLYVRNLNLHFFRFKSSGIMKNRHKSVYISSV